MKFTGESEIDTCVGEELSKNGFKIGDELFAMNYTLKVKKNSIELECDPVKGVLAASKSRVGKNDPINFFIPYAHNTKKLRFKLAYEINQGQYATTQKEIIELFKTQVPKIKDALKDCLGRQLSDKK
jgi:hypothetical protein